MKHIPSLDGLRAVSFGIVFVAHAGLDHWVPGGFGVTVFFFLSGYLITTLMRGEHEKTQTVDLRAFYLRRALRILPPFYLVLTAATLLVGHDLDARAVAAQYLHFANWWIIGHGYDGQTLGTGVYWSLAVEEHYYLLFPLLFLALQRLSRDRQALALYGLCAAILVWRCVLVFALHAQSDRTYLGSDTRFDSILFGAALAIRGVPTGREVLWKWVLPPLCLAVLLLTFVYRDPGFRETFRYTLQGLALTPLFIYALRYPPWLLNTKPFVFVGGLSYSLYLIHHVVLFALRDFTPLLALAVSFALSWLVYVAVEKPCARLRARLQLPKNGAVPNANRPQSSAIIQ